MRRIPLWPWLAAVAALALLAQTANNIKFENPHVRVLVVTDEPHRKSPVHDHKINRVMVYLDAGRQDLTDAATGRVEHQTFRAGEVRWSPARGPHTSENVGDKPFRIVEIELHGRPGHTPLAPLDPLKIDPQHYSLEFENSQVRVLRVKYAPHEKGPMHEHSLPRVATYLTAQNMRATTPDGQVTVMRGSAGEVRWGSPGKHQEENVSDAPFEVIAAEIK